MLKTLMTNACSSDCKYCPFRQDGISNRCSITPDEIAAVFMRHLEKQWLLGIFLSSGIVGNADRSMEKLIAAAEILRKKYRYRGYIHLKILPGASRSAILRALQLASAVSLNIETPGKKYFRELSSYKHFDTDIVAPLKFISENTVKGADYDRVKCTTQFIVGASTETDREIVRYTGAIYDRLQFKRVYYSAYQKEKNPDEFTLDDGSGDALLDREHRLYQADFLMRSYGFSSDELLFDETGNFDRLRDPKQLWADAHPEFYPVKVNKADYMELLRIPGIGPVAARRIVDCRRERRLTSWADAGVLGKTALKAMRYGVFS